MGKLRVLSLFAGIGGFDLGLERTGGFETVRLVERDPFCRAILAKHWPTVACDQDVVTAEYTRGEADVVAGGFPCIDISSSGGKAGITGEHSGLWDHQLRAIDVVRPRWAIVENVTDLLHRGLGVVLGDLASIGYDAEWHCIPAAYAGSPQARDRIWIVAYPSERGRPGIAQRHIQGPRLIFRADDDRLGLGESRARQAPSIIRRMDEWTARDMDRVRACGNIAHPEVVEMIGRAILAADAHRIAA